MIYKVGATLLFLVLAEFRWTATDNNDFYGRRIRSTASAPSFRAMLPVYMAREAYIPRYFVE